MKKLLTLLLAVVLLASFAVTASATDYQGNGVIKKGTAVVDAQLDPEYTGSLHFMGLGKGENLHPTSKWDNLTSANIYLMYDDKYLYIFAEVTDNDVFSKGPTYAMTPNPYLNDCIEFRLNFEGKGGDDSEGKNHKVSIDAYGFSCFGLDKSYAVIDYENLEYAAELTDSGYNVEVAIPCSKGKTNMIKAGKLGFTYQLNDINAGGAIKHFTTSFVGENMKNTVFYNLSTEKAVPGQGDVIAPPPLAEDTTAPKVEDTTAPKVEDTTAPKTEDTTAPKTEDTTAPKTEDTTAPKTEDTTAPKTEDTTAPKTDDTTAPKTDDTTSANDNPDTFDPFVIAAAVTVASGAAFVVASKKKH